MQHHAFVIEKEAEEGIKIALAWAEKELGMKPEGNPDSSVLTYGLLTVADARKITELAAGAPFRGESKVLIITANRAYHEAQNALLKLFEEPPVGVYLFLILPSLGGLLPTLRSRVVELNGNVQHLVLHIPEIAEEFLKATKEKRSTIIKRLTSGSDEEKRRLMREEAIALANGIEVVLLQGGFEKNAATLRDIATLRTHLYDRSAPVRMILEHLAIVTPNNLV